MGQHPTAGKTTVIQLRDGEKPNVLPPKEEGQMFLEEKQHVTWLCNIAANTSLSNMGSRLKYFRHNVFLSLKYPNI